MEQVEMENLDVVEHKDGTTSNGKGQLYFPFVKQKLARHAQPVARLGDDPKNAEALMRFREGLRKK